MTTYVNTLLLWLHVNPFSPPTLISLRRNQRKEAAPPLQSTMSKRIQLERKGLEIKTRIGRKDTVAVE